MLLALLYVGTAQADDRVGDIITTGTVAATPAAVVEVLTDLETFGKLLPTECVGYFKVGITPKGRGAQATLRYDMAAMHRKLEMTVSRVETGTMWLVDMDHAGSRGFISRWLMTPGEAGTTVKLTTPLNTPPWPFAAYFFDAVRPEWEACQAQFIQNVGAEAAKHLPEAVPGE